MGMRGGGGPWGGGGGGKPDKVKPETVKRVVASFRPYTRDLVGIAGAVLVSAGLGLLPPYFLRLIIDRGLQGHNLGIVSRYSVLTILATIGATVFSLLYGYLSVVVGQRIMRDLRGRLFDHLQGMALRFFTGTRTGEIQSRLISDVSGVQGVLSDTAATVLSNVTTVLSTLIAMFLLDWRLTLLAVGLLPLFALLAGQIGTYARGVRKVSAEQNANLSATMQETLSVSGVLLTKTSGRQALTSRRFAGENDALTLTQIKSAMIMRYFFNLIGLTFSITPVGVYWLAGWLLVGQNDTNLTLGTIVAFTALQSRLFFPLTGLLNVQVEVGSALALFDRIFEYLDMKQDIVDAPNAVRLPLAEVRGAVAMENVTFRYDADQENPTLADVSFDALPGQLIALVGPSGAGKTTLTYLIPRLYDADTGRVLIDNHDVKEIALESLGQIVGVVTQETYLVHDTSARTCATVALMPPTSSLWRPPAPPLSMIISRASPKATIPLSASGAINCRVARSSVSPLPALS